MLCGLHSGEIVEFDDLLAVGRVGEFESKHLGVLLGLLEAVKRRPVCGLGLDDCKREVSGVAEEVVDALRSPADEALSDRNDSTVCDRALLGDRVGLVVPACCLQARDDVRSAGIGFARHSMGFYS